jgi:hypothetical protein
VLTGFILSLTNHGSFAQPFIRIYDEAGKKIGKGSIVDVSDTSIEIIGDKHVRNNFLITQIGYIKTKRSLGGYIGWGAAAGLVPVMVTALIIGDPTPSEDRVTIGSLLGDKEWRIIGIVYISSIAAGTAVGIAKGLFTGRKKIIINGDIEKWKIVKEKVILLHGKDIFQK